MLTCSLNRAAVAVAAFGFLLAVPGRGAGAASIAVQVACADDYYAYCSKIDPILDAKGVNACMKANGAKLSQRCIEALLAEGEVTPADIAARPAKK
jgi:hypothetical protein